VDDDAPSEAMIPTADPKVLISSTAGEEHGLRTSAEYMHLVEWAFITPLGACPAVVLWGCWEQGDWYEA
jgi:hypothetical protein